MGILGGSIFVLLIVLVAGLIAYIGDRVGHQVGRKRMTLFGLRPKYTSTIVAVGTGMMIALVITVAGIFVSAYVRTAFFHISELNNKVNELQAQADALERVRNSDIVISRGEALSNQFLILTPQQAPAERLRAFSAFFDSIARALNARYVPRGLRPYVGKSSEPEIAKKLRAVLDDPATQGFLIRGPVLLVAMADVNLFANDPIRFTFAPYADQPIFRTQQGITSVEIDGGTAINPNIAYGQLATAIRSIAIANGMPAFVATVIPALTSAEVADTTRTIKSGRGRYYIVARATADVYPHTGSIPVAFQLDRASK